MEFGAVSILCIILGYSLLVTNPTLGMLGLLGGGYGFYRSFTHLDPDGV